MSYNVESSLSLRDDHSPLFKRKTSFALQRPGKWLSQTTNNPMKFPREVIQSPISSNKPYGFGGWMSTLLHECARAILDANPNKIHEPLRVLNELASPYGDCDQRLAYYFLQAFLAKSNKLGPKCYETLRLVAHNNNYSYCFDTYMKLMLKFQEVSPWTSFGHVASNGAILEALEGENKLHIIDLSNTLCTQWPSFLEALALRSNDEDTPCLKLTVVVSVSIEKSIIGEISKRMEKFARIMGVPFKKLQVINGLEKLEQLTKEDLSVEDGEAIIVNCIQALHKVEVEKRGLVINMFRSIKPCLITVVEEEADFTTCRNHDFLKCFQECLRFFRSYFDMLDKSFLPISNERLKLERERSRDIINILACDNHGEITQDQLYPTENATQWTKRLKQANFSPCHFSVDVLGDVKALLTRYKVVGWDVALPQRENEVGIHLKWRDEPLVWVSAWKPN